MTNHRDSQDDRVIYCNVHSVMYECSGVPTQFYMWVPFTTFAYLPPPPLIVWPQQVIGRIVQIMLFLISYIASFWTPSQPKIISRYVLMLTLTLLVVYMVSTFITLMWLACPFYGNLARFMANYQVEIIVSHQGGNPHGLNCNPTSFVPTYLQSYTQPPLEFLARGHKKCVLIVRIDQEELGKAAEETGQETEARTLLGELFEIYYDNRSKQSFASKLKQYCKYKRRTLFYLKYFANSILPKC